MPPHTLLRFLSVLALALFAWPAQSLAQAPLNDSYLQSIPVNKRGEALPQEPIKDVRNTAEATTQTELFAPMATGGGPERLDCRGTAYGKTIWYDMHPTISGTADIKAAGFDAAISVYEFDPATSKLTTRLDCASAPGGISEEILVEVKAGKSYTVQIGGLDPGTGPAGGQLEFTFEFFGNRDGDTFLDALDKCPTQAGTQDGCPPKLDSNATLVAVGTASGVKIQSLRVEADKGTKVRARCRLRCTFSQTKTSRSGTVSFSLLRGRSLRAGAVLEVFVTKANSIGNYTRWNISRGAIKRTLLCLPPGKSVPKKKCT